MTLIEVTSQEHWDAFVSSLTYAQFTQSWAWGEFQASVGHDVVRVFVLEDGAELHAPLAAVQLIHQPRPLVGGYWLAPRGPVGRLNQGVLDFLVDNLHLPKSVFVRFEPILLASDIPHLTSKFIPHRSYNPATTVLVDLTKSEDELLNAMHQKTRYNIRLAERHGVTVRVTDDIGTFLRLTKETEERDRFSAPDFDYLQKTYRVLSKVGMARLRAAEFEGETLAMSMEMSYGDTVTYLHGASSSRHRDVMAPFALHWDAIKAAKVEGKKTYDFWGCNPESEIDPNYKKSWEGITRLKLGWGGRREGLVGTFDVAKQPVVYRLLAKIGRL